MLVTADVKKFVQILGYTFVHNVRITFVLAGDCITKDTVFNRVSVIYVPNIQKTYFCSVKNFVTKAWAKLDSAISKC